MLFNLDTRNEQEVQEAVQRALRSHWLLQGPEIAAFEQEWASYCEQRHAIGVGSGTEAIRIGLLALGVKPGDEVISPAFNVAFTALAVSSIGATNVFVDCDPQTLLMDVDRIPELVGPRTTAILPVHLFGQMVNMRRVREVADEHGLMVLEDAAHAHGAAYQGHKPGKWSHAVAYSFYPTKNLGALGDAGCVTTNLARVEQHMRLLRDGGRTDRYVHSILCTSSWMDEVQAAALRVKLKYLDAGNDARIALSKQYDNSLTKVAPVARDPRAHHVHHLYVVRSKARAGLRDHLTKCGIPSLIHYPVPVPLQPCFIHSELGSWPNAEQACREVVSLPMRPDLTVDEQREVVRAVNAA